MVRLCVTWKSLFLIFYFGFYSQCAGFYFLSTGTITSHWAYDILTDVFDTPRVKEWGLCSFRWLCKNYDQSRRDTVPCGSSAPRGQHRLSSSLPTLEPSHHEGGSPVSLGVGAILQSQSIAYQSSTQEILQHPGNSSLTLCEAQASCPH